MIHTSLTEDLTKYVTEEYDLLSPLSQIQGKLNTSKLPMYKFT